MLDTASVLVEGKVKEFLIKAFPLIRNKHLKQTVKTALIDGIVAYPVLKRLCALFKNEYQLENLLQQAKMSFPDELSRADLSPMESAKRTYEQYQYERMLGTRRDQEATGEAKSLVRCTSTVVNIMFSVFGSAVAFYMLLKVFTGISLEFRLIWSVLTGFAVLIADMILVQAAQST